MNSIIRCSLIVGLTLCARVACAHVQVLVATVGDKDAQPRAVCELDLRFVQHASQNGPALPMGQPRQFGVVVNNKKTSLTGLLRPKQASGQPAFTASYTLKEAGAHVFYLQPAPYWDADEQVMVTHYTKVVVNSVAAKLPTESLMGWENWEGWDTLVGLPVEIEPTVQCTSLWTGNAFTGIVRVKGKPAPNCRVEVEYLNDNGAIKMPDNSYLTHILKTNTKGEFTYVPARAGWWALTAITESKDDARSPDGKKVESELGGVLWIRCVDMK